MFKTSLDELQVRVDRTADRLGGLSALLLTARSKKLHKISFSKSKARFIVDGKEIDITRIQKELVRVEGRTARKILEFNRKLWSGEWTIDKWREEMENLTEDNHVLCAALAIGSIATAVSDKTTQRRVLRDLIALNRFATAFANRAIAVIEAFNRRARTYLRSYRVTYQLLNQRAHRAAGYRFARRRLTPAEHCRSRNVDGVLVEGCLEAAGRGWMPINLMPPIGTLVCAQFCKCWIEYRREDGPDERFRVPPPPTPRDRETYFKRSIVRGRDGRLKTLYHGSAERIERFKVSKMRRADLDAPMNGFWFADTREGASPAGRDPKYMHQVHLDIRNPITRAELRTLREENPEVARKSPARLRHYLQRLGYDGVLWSSPPEVDGAELIREGVTTFVDTAGQRRRLVQESDSSISLYRGSEYVTGYGSLSEFMEQNAEEIWVAFKPDQIKIRKTTKL